jgi:hypothetical protein
MEQSQENNQLEAKWKVDHDRTRIWVKEAGSEDNGELRREAEDLSHSGGSGQRSK